MSNRPISSNIIYIAQQAIFNADNQIFGYELLFREGLTHFSDIQDADLASMQVISNIFEGFGFNALMGEGEAFINLTRNMILNPKSLPKGRIVIEILEDVAVDDDIIQAAKQWAQEGFRIALDDFTYTPDQRPLLELADYVKIDLQKQPEDALKSLIEHITPYNVKLVAEKVETDAQYRLCQSLGFDYFQGYYLKKPILLKGKIR